MAAKKAKKASKKKTTKSKKSSGKELARLRTVIKEGPDEIEAQINSKSSLHKFELIELSKHRETILNFIQEAERQATMLSLRFWEFFKKKNYDFSDCLVEDKVKYAFRICPNCRKPLDTTGSIIGGGRHHISGAQQHVFFPELSIFFALYSGLELTTAITEYNQGTGLPLGKEDVGYKIHLSPDLKIYDLDKIVEKVDNPLLTKGVSESPVWGEWKYQKFPHISQLIGHSLFKDYGADGLIFKSTKCEGKNLVVFFESNFPSAVNEKVIKEEKLTKKALRE